jgi:uncharacterized protein (TIGR00661 family)
LVAPLDWGLGHATRCIPLIKALLLNGYTVVLAAEGAQAVLLKQEFPDLTMLPLQGYRVQYASSRAGLAFRLILQAPRILNTIRKEHSWLESVIRQYAIDLVISDNRYGLYTKEIPCVFITHQLTIKAPFRWLERWIQQMNYRYINRFTACWVPDAAGEDSLAGVLSHPGKMPKIPVQYIGLLCRWEQGTTTSLYDYMALLSGPEPQRSILEQALRNALTQLPGKKIMVRGKPGDTENISGTNALTIADHLQGDALPEKIRQSEIIICRSGYTTLMELVTLQKKMVLIPTPGQTEQEYLAKRFAEKKWSVVLDQQQINAYNLQTAIQQLRPPAVIFPVFNTDQLPDLLAALH